MRLVPVTAIGRAYRRVVGLKGASLLEYGDPEGHPALRAALASMLASTRALSVTDDDVFITRGSQMALTLVANALVRPVEQRQQHRTQTCRNRGRGGQRPSGRARSAARARRLSAAASNPSGWPRVSEELSILDGEDRIGGRGVRYDIPGHLRATDPDAAVANPGPMERVVDGSLGPRRFNLALIGAFALTAVLLTMVGLHGLVAYVVSQRTAEIGLRLVIGASTRGVQWMIPRQAGGLAIAGALGGLALAVILRLFATRLIAGLSFSPVAAAASGLLIDAVAVLAAWGPARRAARIEPSVTLKSS